MDKILQKPTVYDESIVRDVYHEGVNYHLDGFIDDLNEVQKNYVKHALDTAYHEGFLDGMRYVDTIYQQIT